MKERTRSDWPLHAHTHRKSTQTDEADQHMHEAADLVGSQTCTPTYLWHCSVLSGDHHSPKKEEGTHSWHLYINVPFIWKGLPLSVENIHKTEQSKPGAPTTQIHLPILQANTGTLTIPFNCTNKYGLLLFNFLLFILTSCPIFCSWPLPCYYWYAVNRVSTVCVDKHFVVSHYFDCLAF